MMPCMVSVYGFQKWVHSLPSRYQNVFYFIIDLEDFVTHSTKTPKDLIT